MSIIYRPCGMAREYSPYVLNIYIGCSHRKTLMSILSAHGNTHKSVCSMK